MPFEENPSEGEDHTVFVLRNLPVAGIALKVTGTAHSEGRPYWALALDVSTKGLSKQSYVECYRVLVLEPSKKRRYVGRAAPEDIKKVRETLPRSLSGTIYAQYLEDILSDLS